MKRFFAAIVILAALVAVGACTRFGNCDPQQANGFSTACSGPAGFIWTGSACIWTRACNCSGDDCGSMYRTREACQTAHAQCAY